MFTTFVPVSWFSSSDGNKINDVAGTVCFCARWKKGHENCRPPHCGRSLSKPVPSLILIYYFILRLQSSRLQNGNVLFFLTFQEEVKDPSQLSKEIDDRGPRGKRSHRIRQSKDNDEMDADRKGDSGRESNTSTPEVRTHLQRQRGRSNKYPYLDVIIQGLSRRIISKSRDKKKHMR